MKPVFEFAWPSEPDVTADAVADAQERMFTESFGRYSGVLVMCPRIRTIRNDTKERVLITGETRADGGIVLWTRFGKLPLVCWPGINEERIRRLLFERLARTVRAGSSMACSRKAYLFAWLPRML